MNLLARLMYQSLVWKEKQRARREGRPPGSGDANGSGDGDGPEHLATGQRGETLVYWYLRRFGYAVVARNRRSRKGELDFIAWDGPVLAFVEVKTRTSSVAGAPEDAVSRSKRKRIIREALDYIRRLRQKSLNYRFDIAGVAWDPEAGFQVHLIKDAFKD
jgi:putative endonuclease